MIGTSRGWLAATALGVALVFGAGSAIAAQRPAAAIEHDGLAKKKDGLAEKAASVSDEKDKKDSALDKETLSQAKGLDGIKAPEIKTGDDHKKP